MLRATRARRVSLHYNPITSLRTVPGQAWLVGFPFLLQFPFFNRLLTHNVTCTRVETWCDWERKPTSWVEPLRSVDMVSSGSVYASLRFLWFRDPESFVAGNLRSYRSYWEFLLRGYSKEQEIYNFVFEGVKVHDNFVPFHGSFQRRSYHCNQPPRMVFPNSPSCQSHSDFISRTILEEVANSSLLIWGKVDEVDPPHLVMPITIEPSKPLMCYD